MTSESGIEPSRDRELSNWLGRLRIVEVQHHIFAYGPTHALASYLQERVAGFLYVLHPFREHRYRSSQAILYRKGTLLSQTQFRHLVAPETVLYVKDLIVTFLSVAGRRTRFDLFIGADCLNAFAGLVLRNFGFVRKVILFEIDFSPRRFENPMTCLLYDFLDFLCSRKVDVIWSQSNRIARAKTNQGVPVTKIIVVPQGGLPYGMAPVAVRARHRKRVVFIGNLIREKGLDILIAATDELKKIVPSVEVIVIGAGPHERLLRDDVDKRGLTKHFRFLGYVKDNSEIIDIISSCAIGVAPYMPGQGEFSTYGDPGKVKLYLACGLPVDTHSSSRICLCR